MYCAICGDDRNESGYWDSPRLSSPMRYWAPDDGWAIGRVCRACVPYARRRPRPSDFAYSTRGEFVADMDEAINQRFG